MSKCDMISLVGGENMKKIFVPTKCPKCENKIYFEKQDQDGAAAYCKSCDFILKLANDELTEEIRTYLTLE